jgi:hypothetical protein
VPFARPRTHIRSLVALLAVALMTGVAAQLAGAAQPSTAKLGLAHTSGPLGRASNSACFTDPSDPSSGDGPLDVTSVCVGNDEQPNIEFQIGFANQPSFPTDAGIALFIDTDANPSTGGASGGADYEIYVDGPTSTIGLAKWDGSNFVYLSPEPASLTGHYSGGKEIIDIKQVDLAGTAAFNFWVGAFRNNVEDRAPSSGVWRYDVIVGSSSPPPPPVEKLKVRRFSASPNPPRAGESFVIEYDIVDASTAKAVYAGVTCKGRLGGKTFDGTDLTRRGASFCVYDIPQSATGKVLAGSITVFGDGGSSLTKSFQYKVVRPPVHLHFVGVATAPTQPQQGASFLIAAGVEILEQGRPTKRIDASAKGSCRASVAGRNVPSNQSQWQSRGWLCGWSVPFGTRGQTFVITITITWHGVSVSRSVHYRVE